MEHKDKYKFTSERLGFRAWDENDIEPFAAMNSNKSVMEYFPKTLSKVESKKFVKKIITVFNTYEYGLYAVDELQTNEFIGFIGFSHPSFELEFDPFIEIGWRLKEDKWNKGFATEGAKRCLKFGFEELNFEDIYSFTSKVNKRSERVMQKIGMKKIREFEHPNIEVGNLLKPHVLYKIEKNKSVR